MNETSTRTRLVQRLLHYLAVLTVLATLPLLTLGAEVTTRQVGMVDAQGFRTPWHIFTVPLRELGLGFLIEHGHRLAGFIVGFLMILLTVGAWWVERRAWLRLLATLTLVAVCLQGLLGGFRVQLNALVGPELALIHGLFAQVVFCLLVSFALFTAPSWRDGNVAVEVGDRTRLRRWSLFLVGTMIVQVVLGALTRHTEIRLAPRLHLLTAFVVVSAVVGLSFALMTTRPRVTVLDKLMRWMWLVVGMQIFLGLEAWLTRFRVPGSTQTAPLVRPSTETSADLAQSVWHQVIHHPDFMRSVHLPVGALLLSLSVALCLYLWREVHPALVPQPRPLPELDEVAA